MSQHPTQPEAIAHAAVDAIIEAKPLGGVVDAARPDVLHSPRVSVVIPCLNESRTIAGVVSEAIGWAERSRESIEVVVADNGSTDGSVAIAEKAGARVVPIAERGYGSAIRGGLASALGDVLVIGDADGQHDFSQIGEFVRRIDGGCDMVVGSRFEDRDEARRSIPWLNRTIGAPALSAIGRTLSGAEVRDFHCGYRAISRQALGRLTLTCDGMEFATEMIVRAAQARLRIEQCPVTIRPAGRDRPPHLRPVRDGLRHMIWMVRNT
ncbi:MAG: glycosyltransferase family 2 protein [Phycisphaerales bacterium JB058]